MGLFPKTFVFNCSTYIANLKVDKFGCNNQWDILFNKMAYTAKDPCPPTWRFMYLTETKSWKWEGEGGEGGEKVSLMTHASARGMGKKRPFLHPSIVESGSGLAKDPLCTNFFTPFPKFLVSFLCLQLDHGQVTVTASMKSCLLKWKCSWNHYYSIYYDWVVYSWVY